MASIQTDLCLPVRLHFKSFAPVFQIIDVIRLSIWQRVSENGFGDGFEKRSTWLKHLIINMSRVSQRRRIGRTLRKQKTTVRTNNDVRLRSHCMCSVKSLEHVVCIWSRCKLRSTCSKKCCQEHRVQDLTRSKVWWCLRFVCVFRFVCIYSFFCFLHIAFSRFLGIP